MCYIVFFFFQAEDGIRDIGVTGVQKCALPISAAGLHLALALHNAATVEMGGPIMLAEDVGDLRAYYERDRVTVPDGPGLGVQPDEAILKRYAGERSRITA